MFKIVRGYYNKGIYSASDVGKFVQSGRLTADEYKTITGIDYIA